MLLRDGLRCEKGTRMLMWDIKTMSDSDCVATDCHSNRFVEMLIRIYITWGRVNGRGSERIVHHSGFYVAKILKSFDCFVLIKKHD